MFLPTTPEELKILGWDALDIILVSGDSYIDSPYMGVAVIGKLLQTGWLQGRGNCPARRNIGAKIFAAWENRVLFWGVSGGCVNSMVANYTALKEEAQVG